MVMKEKISEIADKINRKIHPKIYHRSDSKLYKFFLYRSYRHYVRTKNKEINGSMDQIYLTAVPNRGAGIGHQMDGWSAGVLLAKRWGIQYAYSPFHNQKWDTYLGFYEGSPSAKALIKEQKYHKVRLPYFNEKSPSELAEIEQIIKSYAGKKVVFFLELDQFCYHQYEVADYLREHFMNATARKEDSKLYDEDYVNIAVHVRRGDIVDKNGKVLDMYKQRWLSMEYYRKVLDTLLEVLKEYRTRIYIFSQGEKENFSEFACYPNVIYCLDGSEQDTFGNLIKSDILVMGKSSFSFDSALIQNGIRIYPAGFWGTCPESEEWIRLGDDGVLSSEQKESILKQVGADPKLSGARK